jgi:fimbrial chaperone protein
MLRARTRELFASALAVALASLAPAPARGGDLEISPIVVDLGRARSTLVTVRNAAKEAGRYELHAFAWDESPLGQMKLEPAKDLLVFPPVLELAPGQEKKIRIGTTAAPGERERTWRVFIEEILPATTVQEATRLRTRLRIGVPVFLAPQRAIAGGEIVGLGVEHGKITFLLKNAGTVRIHPSTVRVVATDASDKPVFEKSFQGWYVLAGGDRLYEIDLPADACAKAKAVAATAVLEQSSIEARQPVAGGACAP